jgi:RNA polymerase sigma-70 factor (ECF subfamily)
MERSLSRFATTHWSLILDGRHDPQQARAALVEICGHYRAPILSYLRHHGYSGADAEDLTQEFFARLIEQRWDTRADPARGRFRSFLLTALRRFLANEQAHLHTRKRGGHLLRVELEESSLEAPEDQSPEYAFNRAWVLALMEHAAARLEQEARAAGREALYRHLVEYVVETPDSADYSRVAALLGMKPNTIAVHVHRLRRRLRELIREELVQTVSDAEGLDAELCTLRDIIGKGHLH